MSFTIAITIGHSERIERLIGRAETLLAFLEPHEAARTLCDDGETQMGEAYLAVAAAQLLLRAEADPPADAIYAEVV